MEGLTRVIVVGDEPPEGLAGEQLNLLLRGLHLRADTRVGIAWARGETPNWRTYASQRVVVDELRTWAPARWATPAGPTVAGKVRGAALRRRLAPLRAPDVLLSVDGTGEDLVRRLLPAGRRGTIHTGAAPRLASLPGSFELALGTAGEHLWDERPGTAIALPYLVDGAWARAAGLPNAREATRSALRLPPGPILVGVESGAPNEVEDFVDLVAEVLRAASRPLAGALWLSPTHDGQLEAQVSRAASRVGLGGLVRVEEASVTHLAVGDVVVVGAGTPIPLLLQALSSGAHVAALADAVDPSLHEFIDTASHGAALADAVAVALDGTERDRIDRLEQVRDRIDLVPAAARIVTALHAEMEVGVG